MGIEIDFQIPLNFDNLFSLTKHKPYCTLVPFASSVGSKKKIIIGTHYGLYTLLNVNIHL